MYLMVAVVAAVDAVYNVSFTQSEAVWRCAYCCAEQKITRGGFWDQLPPDSACPLIFPKRVKPRSTFSTTFSPLVCQAHPRLTGACVARWKIVSKLVIKDDPKLVLRRDV
jgi:hypothetical protein